MKKFVTVLSLCFLFIMAVATVCFAEDATDNLAENQSEIQEWMVPAEGDWYNTKGDFVMTIQGNTINGCTILSAKDYTLGYPRSGVFAVAEEKAVRNIKLDLFGNKSHQYIIVDNNMVLRRSIHPAYNESMGGIYLGMTKDDLLNLYKQPTSVAVENGLDRLNYDNHKFAIFFKNNIIVAIRMFKNSDRHFDKSGLGANDTAAAYAQAYGFNETPEVPTATGAVSPAYKIDQGEFFYFSPDYVELSVYNN